MADDILNEGSEEENDSFGGGQSDDDFGLPDLEFDDLEELNMGDDDSDSESEEVAPVNEEVAPVSEDVSPVGDDVDMGSQAFDMSLLEDTEMSLPDLEGLGETDLNPPEGNVLDEGIDEMEDVLDSAQLISDRLGDDDITSPSDGLDDVNYGDLNDAPSTIEEDELPDLDFGSFDTEVDSSSDDLFADINSPDDLAALGMDEESGDLTSDSSVGSTESLFSADDVEGASAGDSIFGSDSMSVESEEKLEFEPAQDSTLPPNYKSYTYEEKSGGFTKIIVIGIVVIAVVASGLLYFGGGDDVAKKTIAKKEKNVAPKKRTVAKAKPTVVDAEDASTDNTASTATTAEEKPKVKDAVPVAKPKPEAVAVASSASPGEIQRISERTSMSYVIIGSFIDEDMAMDYAVKLSEEGKGVKIIEPYGKSKRHRVSIADYSSYGDAAGQLDNYKADYGDQVWALKY